MDYKSIIRNNFEALKEMQETMTKEQDIQGAIIKYIQSIGGMAFKQNQIGIYAQAGVPDLLCCVKGRFVAIEVKKPKKKPTAIQNAFIEAINKCGGLAFYATSVEEVKSTIENNL